MTREISYTPQELVHPAVVNGRNLWLSPEVEGIVHKMQHGDPVLGWEGDPRLALYLDQDCWVVERLEADGVYRPVCRSRPGLALDERLLIHLRQHDIRGGFDLEGAAEGGEKPLDGPDAERMREGLERVYHAAAKDLGIV